MRPVVHSIIAAAALAVVLPAVLGGCKREGKPIPPPTPEQVQTGVEQSKERVRNNPNLTPEQKEKALRMLDDMAAAARMQPQQQTDGK
ncbi:MAG: hypothetical protein GX446_06885 [Chthonomonadales bacterium]|nr:hypothetical protein [Chthonomonadales bacterium]